MRIPLVGLLMDGKPAKWWEWLFAPIVLPLMCAYFALMALVVAPLLALTAVVAVPFSGLHVRRLERDEALLRRALAKAGRIVNWSEIEPSFAKGRGTLILELPNLKQARWWWTNDDVIAEAPMRPPGDTVPESRDGAMVRYAQACVTRYLDPASGVAVLVDEVKLPGSPPEAALAAAVKAWKRATFSEKLAMRYPAGKLVMLDTRGGKARLLGCECCMWSFD